MAHGYLNDDGEFIDFDDLEKAARCDACKQIVKEKSGEYPTPNTEHINAESLGLKGYSGYADICSDCLLDGVGEKRLEEMKNNFFDEQEEY